jgi:DNA-binding HxlR family transcriptional regulator
VVDADGPRASRRPHAPLLAAPWDLPGVTARALALALKDLEGSGLVARRVLESYPPATVYALTPSAAPLAGAVEGLAA